MAYTIISQNNNTTTLSDGVNTITVPSRVNLTSGNFTIVEVNNNMATLEDGDGNVYRDIPCVATLAGEGGGGGSGLPDQTGHSGEFLTTDGTDASWSDKPLVNTATGNYSMCIGQTGSSASGQNSLAIGSFAQSTDRSVAIGAGAVTNVNYTVAIGNQAGCYGGQGAVALGSAARANAANAIQIAATNNVSVNSDINTFKVANANGNFEMMSADGTIPTARLTKVNTTITLAAADWNSNTQTVSVTGMTATGIVMVSPDPTDQSAYTSAGIICSAQAAGTLTFTCSTTPTADLSVNVVML